MVSAPKVVLWQPVFARLVREAMSRLDAPTQAMMRMLVCLAPQPASIPLAIFSGRADSEQARASLNDLKKSGLVATADDAQSILVHRLVREVIRDRLSPEQMSSALDSARAVIEGALPKSERSGAGAAVRERLLPRLQAPVGLRLGGEGPEAIALAIVAALQRSGEPA